MEYGLWRTTTCRGNSPSAEVLVEVSKKCLYTCVPDCSRLMIRMNPGGCEHG